MYSSAAAIGWASSMRRSGSECALRWSSLRIWLAAAVSGLVVVAVALATPRDRVSLLEAPSGANLAADLRRDNIKIQELQLGLRRLRQDNVCLAQRCNRDRPGLAH